MNDVKSIDSMINELFLGRGSGIVKDIKLNFKRVLSEGSLNEEESLLALLATSTSLKHNFLVNYSRERLSELGVDSKIIQEASESAALTGMLNTYYRFKHHIENIQGDEAKEKYKRIGLRINALSKPLMGHEKFEMLTFAVSVINGCEMCVNGHEKKLLDMNVELDKIHDLVRLSSLVKAAVDLNTISEY